MNIVEKKLGDLKPYEKNPRKNENAVPYVVKSIKRYGFKNPIIIDKDGVIIAGHTRYLASIELGLDTVPCIVADDLTEEEVKEFRLVDNKTAEFAGWDFTLLDEELQELDFDAEAFGFDLSVDEPKERIDLSDEIMAQYQVVVECRDEMEQEDVYNFLDSEGYICRVLTL